MSRSLPSGVLRALVAVTAALVVALASLSLGTTPAGADANEGASNVDPGNRARQAAITAGLRHTCAVLGTERTVWCWGDNAQGQLGNGTTTASATPVRVGGLSGVTAISAGGNHTCALLESGQARCWGGNNVGQLGIGTAVSSRTPVVVSGDHAFTTIAASELYTCGTTASQVLCWGFNGTGQLGNGTFAQASVPTPTLVPGAPVLVSTGRLHACAVTQGGEPWCWGHNAWGQLGAGTTGATVPTPTRPTTALTGVEAISVGDLHTCAIAAGGTKCWGNNDNGQLGNGQAGLRSVATSIGGGPATSEQAITSGNRHSCGRQPDRIRCWGTDNDGQLGNGPGGSSSVPVDVVGHSPGAEVPAVTAGAFHTCTQLSSGQVDCWGDNAWGQLGDGTTTDRTAPVRIIDLPGTPVAGEASVTYGAVRLTWTAPPPTGGLPVKRYRIRDLDGTLDVLVAGDATSHTVTGLTPGRTYRLQLTAVNEIGVGQGVEYAPVTMPTSPVISVADVSYAEGNAGTKNMTFTLVRSGPSTSAASVKAVTVDGSASSATDYYAKPLTTINFGIGQTTKTFVVTTRGDLLTEDDENFEVVLSAPVNATLLDPTGTGTLVNDDAGEKPSYSIADVSQAEGNAGSTNMTFTITRSGSTAVAGSVKYFTQTVGQASAPSDFTAKAPTLVNFPVGVTSKTVVVAIKGDLVAEPDEYFQVRLGTPVNGDLESFPFAYGLIQNDDSNATSSVAIGDVTTTEGDAFSRNVTFTVTRSGSLAGTTALKFTTQNGSAIAPGDYTARALSNLTFYAGESTKTITVAVRGDAVAEPDEHFLVVLSAVTGGVIADAEGRGTIVDDD